MVAELCALSDGQQQAALHFTSKAEAILQDIDKKISAFSDGPRARYSPPDQKGDRRDRIVRRFTICKIEFTIDSPSPER